MINFECFELLSDDTEFNFSGQTLQNGLFAKVTIKQGARRGTRQCGALDVVFNDFTFFKTELIDWDFTNCQFRNCKIDRLLIRASSLSSVKFENCEICKLILRDADIDGLTLSNCELDRCLFTESVLQNIVVDDCSVPEPRPNSKLKRDNKYCEISVDDFSIEQLHSLPFYSID